jgi:acyl-coenzyme A thioesterase PaaI-like protein
MLTDVPDGSRLPPHSEGCLGCGPANPHGHHLQVHRDGDTVVGVHTFDGRHVGAPGIAHGGAVATVFDDVFGFLLFVVGELAVTRSLTVDYSAPALLGTEYCLTAGLDRREGRRLHVSAHLRRSDGHQIASATAIFIVVSVDHFVAAQEQT